MNNRILEIIKELNDNRSKLSALYSLYNSSVLVAENSRLELSNYYEQMIDLKNDINTLSNMIAGAKKAERVSVLNKNKSKIKHLDSEMNLVHGYFTDSCKKYRIALKECGSLKSEYKHVVSELCKEFKSLVDENTDVTIIKGYKQQVKVIKAILEKIDALVEDYNVKKNKVEDDNAKFVALFESANELISQMKTTA
jgi:hypothetical protein